MLMEKVGDMKEQKDALSEKWELKETKVNAANKNTAAE